MNISVSLLEPRWDVSVRGLYQVEESVAWASGSKGRFMRTTDGETWQIDSIPGFTHLDFRDIHAFSDQEALIMAAGDEGRILKTTDGGRSWTEVYANLEEGIFLDGMDFQGSIGYCVGDPLNGYPFILRSVDKGDSWKRLEKSHLPSAISGEGSYAASGTTLIYTDDMVYAAFGGDSLTRILKADSRTNQWESVQVPLRIGEGCGIFSMAFQSEGYGVAVGGCYLDSTSSLGNISITRDYGRTWVSNGIIPPHGYRSCVVYHKESHSYICCGRTGVDISYDGGYSWRKLSEEGYYTCSVFGKRGWLMGRTGRLARIDL